MRGSVLHLSCLSEKQLPLAKLSSTTYEPRVSVPTHLLSGVGVRLYFVVVVSRRSDGEVVWTVEEIVFHQFGGGTPTQEAAIVARLREISPRLAHLLPLLSATLGLPHIFVLFMITRSEMESVCLLRLCYYFGRRSFFFFETRQKLCLFD
jgi:hypothetical protein